ncbi:uncharacterized protein KY384_000059 [Bacidia gigantensis]|uniref:uncharacterized protein n=1 Tax=Bacidia gigantensis TaxID=2732470 RepID=UPI001D0400A2|nr:uncharacterized protein KY384_000059 [Bacidia gigantensis]KAG8526403.1 hypothetical protein KY384_000059 [Bacidia gigantensis]
MTRFSINQSVRTGLTCMTLWGIFINTGVYCTPMGDLSTRDAPKPPKGNAQTPDICALDKNNPVDVWSKSGAGTYLDNIIAMRGSGKMGSLKGLDQAIDRAQSGSGQSTMNCAEITDDSHCPAPGKCEDAWNPSAWWVQLAFSNMHQWLGQMLEVFEQSVLMEALDVDSIVDDVVYSFRDDRLKEGTILGMVGSSLGIAAGVGGAVPGIGPTLVAGFGTISGVFSIANNNDAADSAETDDIIKDTKKALEQRLRSALEETSEKLKTFAAWMWKNGDDWTDEATIPLTLGPNDKNLYLPSRFFDNGVFVNGGNFDFKSIQKETTLNLDDKLWTDKCNLDELDRLVDGRCFKIMYVDNPTKDVELPSSLKDGMALFKKYDIDIEHVYRNVRDCSVDHPNGDGVPALNDISGLPPGRGYPKCFFSIPICEERADLKFRQCHRLSVPSLASLFNSTDIFIAALYSTGKQLLFNGTRCQQEDTDKASDDGLWAVIMSNNTAAGNPVNDFLKGNAGAAQNTQGIQVKAFVLNLGIALATFAVQLSGFFLLKSSAIGRRIYQPKTYLVQHRLRVESVPGNPLKWLRRIWSLEDEELAAKCGLDGYFFIRLLRALLIIFVPLMCIVITALLPINYHGGRDTNVFRFHNQTTAFNVTGLDTLSWQNVSPEKTHRYWGHLICALLTISWSLYRIYREKLNFIHVRQRFLTSPEHRLKASAKTVLITNIPTKYRSKDALEALYDVFVDNDDHDKLSVWINRDYGALRALAARRRSLRHLLEKAELKILRHVNKSSQKTAGASTPQKPTNRMSSEPLVNENQLDGQYSHLHFDNENIDAAFEKDCSQQIQPQHGYVNPSPGPMVIIEQSDNGIWQPASTLKFWIKRSQKNVPKIAWLRYEIARLTIEIESMLQNLDDDTLFPKQNSAFIQFDRQMAAHMCCALVSHDRAGCMAPRYLEASPHEILWPNMNVTSLGRFIRTCIALVLFVAILFLWGIPTTLLASVSQLDSLRASVKWLIWLRPWPSWVISLISGPLVSILLFLLVQLVVPALCRKLAVLVGAPTRSKRETIAQNFYFTFLFIELVLVTSISSGIANVIPKIANNPISTPLLLATDLPRSANYFFNYLIVQALTFTGSLLFQYLRILYITLIWPLFSQTPREEAWLQTTIPHQMWANQYSLTTNFAVIGFIYCIISPLVLLFVSITFSLFWIAYRHNYYFVQRNKIDTHGLLFNNALSQLFAGIYVLEITLIGLFFLVRDTDNRVVCSVQAIIMIVVLIITAIFHFVMEQHLKPLYEFIPVTLEDVAADAEKDRFLTRKDDDTTIPSIDNAKSSAIELSTLEKPNTTTTHGDSSSLNPKQPTTRNRDRAATNASTLTAASARRALSIVKRRAQVSSTSSSAYHHLPTHSTSLSSHPDEPSHKREAKDQLGAAIASYPDALTDLSPEERDANLKAAFQDPVTREPRPVIWIPADEAGVASEVIRGVEAIYGPCPSRSTNPKPNTDPEPTKKDETILKKEGRDVYVDRDEEKKAEEGPWLRYSCTGARLRKNGKVQITQPAPDVRADWCLEWQL